MSLVNVWIATKIGLFALIPIITGFFLTGALLQSTPLRRNFGLTLGLGIPLGWGAHALLYFGWRVTGLATAGLFVIEIGMLVASGLLFLRSEPYFRLQPPPPLPRRWRIFLGASLVVALGLAGLPMVIGYAWFPHGTWDAWAIWNLVARYFFLGKAEWTQLFYQNNYHPDYPILVGASLARLWAYFDSTHPLAGGINSALISMGTVLLVGSGLAFRRSLWVAILGVLLCLASSAFLVIPVAQIADIPLGLFILALILCSVLAEELPGPQPALWVLAGIFAGLAAWTKNEGLLVVASFLIVRVGVHLWRRDWHGLRNEQAWIWIGLLPLLAMLAGFKIAFAPPNDLVAAQGGGTLGRLLDPQRIRTVIEFFLNQSYTIRIKRSVPVIFLALFLVVAGVRRDTLRRRAYWHAVIVLALILAGYFVIYLVSPYDAAWHLQTSIHRLFLHLWPSAVFLTMLAARLDEFDPRPAIVEQTR